jgi:2-polyprenyl-6-methoxyphenol hydroxylase-like FAD-dependent oxidoreductase
VYDMIVVGARCAGSPTAMLLARKGYRVLLLDRATFPSDTLSTHFILYQGLCCLQRWGLLERVLTSGCPPVHRWTLHNGDFPITGYPPVAPGLVSGCAPRRSVFDTILVHAAIEAGAEFQEGVLLQDLLWEGERVTGIRGSRQNCTTFTEEARLVISADGMRSRVAQAVHAPHRGAQREKAGSARPWKESRNPRAPAGRAGRARPRP